MLRMTAVSTAEQKARLMCSSSGKDAPLFASKTSQKAECPMWRQDEMLSMRSLDPLCAISDRKALEVKPYGFSSEPSGLLASMSREPETSMNLRGGKAVLGSSLENKEANAASLVSSTPARRSFSRYRQCLLIISRTGSLTSGQASHTSNALTCRKGRGGGKAQ